MSGLARPPWPAFRAALDAAGFHPSRRLGQNFLVDDNVVQAIVRDAGVRPGDAVLEVGPGCGFLTLHLAAAGARVVAVEIDRRLEAIARGLVPDELEVAWIRGDVLAGKHRLAPEVRAALPAEGPWSLVANLPYSVSSPLLVVLSRLENPPERMTVLVQDEVGERLVADPGEPAWGPLTARLRRLYRARRTRGVPARLFWPRPKVESAVVRLDLEPGDAAGPGGPAERRPAPAELERYDELVGRLFTGRRKTLRALLGRERGGAERARTLLEGAGIDSDRRPDTLAPREIEALVRALAAAGDRPPGAGPA